MMWTLHWAFTIWLEHLLIKVMKLKHFLLKVETLHLLSVRWLCLLYSNVCFSWCFWFVLFCWHCMNLVYHRKRPSSANMFSCAKGYSQGRCPSLHDLPWKWTSKLRHGAWNKNFSHQSQNWDIHNVKLQSVYISIHSLVRRNGLFHFLY